MWTLRARRERPLPLVVGLALLVQGCTDEGVPLRWVDIPAGTAFVGLEPAEHAAWLEELAREGESSVGAGSVPPPSEVEQVLMDLGGRQVVFSSFQMSATEVTVARYRRCVAQGTCDGAVFQRFAQCRWDEAPHPDEPVGCLSWQQARVFAAGAGGRLPTEGEWEYAARAGTRQRYAGTDDAGQLCRFANVLGRGDGPAELVVPHRYGCDDGQRGVARVARFEPNAWGLYDMSGNAGSGWRTTCSVIESWLSRSRPPAVLPNAATTAYCGAAATSLATPGWRSGDGATATRATATGRTASVWCVMSKVVADRRRSRPGLG